MIEMLFLYQVKNIEKKVGLFSSEAATQRCSYVKVIWKYATNLQEKTHAKVYFQ